MPVETLIEDYKKQKRIIISALAEQDRIIDKIQHLGDEDKDWITPKTAAGILSSSAQWIYQLRDNGTLTKLKYVGRRLYVSRKEVEAIDDKPRFGK